MSQKHEERTTLSGIPLKTFYRPEDVADLDYERDLNDPGKPPYTRGVYPTMYRGRLWTMRQYAGFGTAEETNERFHYLLSQGQTGLSIAFDLPTQLGYDPDHPMAEGEVGKVGVSIWSVEAMERVMRGIPLEKVSTSMTINATAPILLAFYLVLAEERGVPWERLRGTVQNDILKEFAARGNYIYPVRPSMRLVGDLIEFAAKHVPQWYPISISGYHYREAGATAVQELAFTLADGIAYVEEVRRRGLDVDTFAARLSFFFAAHNNFFEEIAKFRAARKLWARIMRERFGARDPRSMRLRFHTQTAGSTLTAQEPLNNIIRVAYQAMAAVLGGTQSLHTNGYDEALSLPTPEAARLALRTQQILAYETGVPDVVDPLAGSFFVEWLTGEMERRVATKLQEIDEMGGAVACVEARIFQQEIEESAFTAQEKVDSGELVVVGVNRFRDPEALEQEVPILEVSDEIARVEAEAVARFRENRSQEAVRRALDDLKRTAEKADENLMPSIIEAVRQRATLGEIADALRDVWGTFDEG